MRKTPVYLLTRDVTGGSQSIAIQDIQISLIATARLHLPEHCEQQFFPYRSKTP